MFNYLLNLQNKGYKVQEKISDTLQSAEREKWYLRILDKTIFGPVDLDTLCSWANQARIIPGHHISSDQITWISVESVEEFHMTWQVTMKNGDIYGPVNINLLKNLVQDDIIDATATIKNIITNETSTVINQMVDLINEDTELKLRLKEANSRYLAAESKCRKLSQQLQQEKLLREKENSKNIKIQEGLKKQIEKAEKEKHAIEVMDVYPEAILVDKSSQNSLSRIVCTDKTLQQIEAQATNELLNWHKQYKETVKNKKKRFFAIPLFK